MAKKYVKIEVKALEKMVRKIREYKSANRFLNDQIEKYNKKFGELKDENSTNRRA